MNLREQILKDVAIFLNPAEFGEHVTIDGVKTVGIWDDTLASQSSPDLNGINDASTFALLGHTKILLVPSDAIVLPDEGQEIFIDDECWQVVAGTHKTHGIMYLYLQRPYS